MKDKIARVSTYMYVHGIHLHEVLSNPISTLPVNLQIASYRSVRASL